MKGRNAKAPSAERLYDELLVTLVQSGDRRAGERLAIRWQPRLARTARRLLADDEAALGVVQETWLSILRGVVIQGDGAERLSCRALGIGEREGWICSQGEPA